MTNKEDSPSIYYWDACVFLAYIEADPNRAPIISAIFDDCDDGKAKIFTSMLSVAEVSFAEFERRKKLSKKVESRINKLWMPPSPVMLSDVHFLITHEAKQLIRDAVSRGWSLKPPDAIHLITAKRMNVEEFHTYDERLFRFDKLVGFPIIQPHTSRLPFAVDATKYD